MKKIVEYLPLLSICLIYFGFCNLHGYYKEFNVNIYVYITTTEIIMAFFPTIVFVSSIVSTSLIQEFVGKPNIIHKSEAENQGEVSLSKTRKFFIWLFSSFLTWLFIMVSILSLLRWVLRRHFNYQSYDFQEFNLFASASMLVGLLWFMSYTGRRDIIRNNPVVVVISLVCYIGMQISSYRKLDAETIKAGIPLCELSFKYHTKTVSTSKQLLYIGQTSGQIFFYDRTANNTLVYKTSDVDSLVIKN